MGNGPGRKNKASSVSEGNDGVDGGDVELGGSGELQTTRVIGEGAVVSDVLLSQPRPKKTGFPARITARDLEILEFTNDLKPMP